MSGAWTREQRQKFDTSIIAKRRAVPTPTCRDCPGPLDPKDVQTGCIRCKACRKGKERICALNPPKPVNLQSWWLVGQSREQQAEWFDRAKAEAARMLDSPEAKKLGYRRAVDEVGGMRRTAVGTM